MTSTFEKGRYVSKWHPVYQGTRSKHSLFPNTPILNSLSPSKENSYWVQIGSEVKCARLGRLFGDPVEIEFDKDDFRTLDSAIYATSSVRANTIPKGNLYAYLVRKVDHSGKKPVATIQFLSVKVRTSYIHQ